MCENCICNNCMHSTLNSNTGNCHVCEDVCLPSGKLSLASCNQYETKERKEIEHTGIEITIDPRWLEQN